MLAVKDFEPELNRLGEVLRILHCERNSRYEVSIAVVFSAFDSPTLLHLNLVIFCDETMSFKDMPFFIFEVHHLVQDALIFNNFSIFTHYLCGKRVLEFIIMK